MYLYSVTSLLYNEYSVMMVGCCDYFISGTKEELCCIQNVQCVLTDTIKSPHDTFSNLLYIKGNVNIQYGNEYEPMHLYFDFFLCLKRVCFAYLESSEI